MSTRQFLVMPGNAQPERMYPGRGQIVVHCNHRNSGRTTENTLSRFTPPFQCVHTIFPTLPYLVRRSGDSTIIPPKIEKSAQFHITTSTTTNQKNIMRQLDSGCEGKRNGHAKRTNLRQAAYFFSAQFLCCLSTYVFPCSIIRSNMRRKLCFNIIIVSI